MKIILKCLSCLIFLLISLVVKGQSIKIEKLDAKVNTSQYHEISPVLSWDGKMLFFTRVAYPEFEKNLVIEGKDVYQEEPMVYGNYLRDVYSRISGKSVLQPENSDYNQDIWMVKLEENEIGELTHPGPPLNNALPNSVCSLTPSLNEYIVLNRFYPEGGMEKGFSIIRKEEDSWSFPKPLEIKEYYTKSDGVSLTMSADGQVIVLSLERDDTHGKNDLYVCFRESDTTFTAPLNLGLQINSSSRETTPTLSVDKKVIYFSSSRRGNNDIYFARRLDDTWTNWSIPRRFVPPINSEADDSQPFFNPATGYLYFTSTRDGSSDIYRVKIAKEEKPEIIVKGTVINSQTRMPEAAKVYAKSLGTDKYNFLFNSHDGHFNFRLPAGDEVRFEAARYNFIGHPEVVSLSENFYRKEMEVTLWVDPITTEGSITLKPIFFIRSTAEILEVSHSELDYLASIMEMYPGLTIRIEGHTDNQGPIEALQQLSEDRANAIRDFLVAKGIDPERITTKGFGPAQPINDNSTEERRAKNRRVEIRITGTGGKLKG